ncbi:GNAT family N-acetyltransferase [Leifsonia shinshuensis]|uniref:Ribosomal protein S18 acetylase RimI-like enzyme n=1 Tax=Leifsonia shinshuensis TaxID=150026 RepID=A0A853CXQ4_9MICO|nr:GNAT family N-acetyltransferase [Leifsonia shinshuensis]NYJ25312.1 ribosomal protein S18 acetylase RimI-like enzyme [Leifsonia shinshuensis]
MTVVIRPATPGDAVALASVAAVTFPLACPPHTTEEAKAAFIATVLSAERFGEYTVDPERRLLVAEDAAGEVIGYTMVNLGEPADADVRAALRVRPTAELSKCYVLPGHHGEGVAGRLMEASLAAAAAAGAEGIWLGVNEENARAQRFYGKHGFERVGSKRFLVGDRLEDDWVMERALVSPPRP